MLFRSQWEPCYFLTEGGVWSTQVQYSPVLHLRLLKNKVFMLFMFFIWMWTVHGSVVFGWLWLRFIFCIHHGYITFITVICCMEETKNAGQIGSCSLQVGSLQIPNITVLITWATWLLAANEMFCHHQKWCIAFSCTEPWLTRWGRGGDCRENIIESVPQFPTF